MSATDSPSTNLTSESNPSNHLGPSNQAGPSNQPGSTFDLPSVTRMGAESGYEMLGEEDVPPLRPSGIVALVLGVLSFSAAVAPQMLLMPAAAIAFGLYALRKSSGPRPAGTTAAKIGLALACGFGACGFMIPYMKYRTLGLQAAYFSKEYLNLLGSGEESLGLELQKTHPNRQVETMDIEAVYQEDDIAMELLENAKSGAFADIIQAEGRPQWELAQGVRVYTEWYKQKADVYWIDTSGEISQKIHMVMQWTPDDKTGRGEWHVALLHYDRKRLVAPSIL